MIKFAHQGLVKRCVRKAVHYAQVFQEISLVVEKTKDLLDRVFAVHDGEQLGAQLIPIIQDIQKYGIVKPEFFTNQPLRGEHTFLNIRYDLQ